MIKPIVYHSFQEKELLEKKLMNDMPLRKRQSVSKALISIFYNPGKKSKPNSAPIKSKRDDK